MYKRRIKFIFLLPAAALLSFGCGFSGAKDNSTEEDTTEEDGTVWDAITIDIPEVSEPDPDRCIPCESDGDCPDDYVFCNGFTRCDTGINCCIIVENPCGDNPDICMEYSCIESLRQCVENPVDSDDDGYPAMVVNGTPCEGGTDCNDERYSIHPGAGEACDEEDNDCDFLADEDSWTAAGSPEPPLSSSGARAIDAGIIAMDAGWLVAWSESAGPSPGIMIAKFNEEGEGPAPVPLAHTTGAGEVEIIANEAGMIFIFWIENGTVIKGKKLSYDGTVHEEAEVTIFEETVLVTEAGDLDAAMEPDGGHASIFFRGHKDGNCEVYTARINLDTFSGPSTGEPDRITRSIGFSGFPSAASNENLYLVAWEDERDGNKEIYAASVSHPGGETGREIRLTAAPGDSRHPSVSASPGGFRVVWMDESAGAFTIMAARLDETGAPRGFPIAMSESGGASYYPCASHDPRGDGYTNQHLVIYTRGAENKLNLTAVGELSVDIQPGIEIHGANAQIEKPAIAGGVFKKAAIWIESSYAAGNLYFIILECV